MKAPHLSVVVPCYNEQESLAELYRRVRAVCESVVGGAYELILVNDGSRDRTWPQMLALAEQDSHVVAANLARHYGHQVALTAGLSVALGERILVIDADLQDPPELLAEMMRKMDEGCDVVYGQRIEREGETAFKRVTATLFYRLLRRLVDIDMPLDTGDFRLMNRRVLDLLMAMPEQHRFIRGMVSWIGLRQEPVRYQRSARFAGRTKYPLAKMVRFALDAVMGFSILPLRTASYLGALTGLVGLFMLIYVVGSWLVGATVAGWTSLMVVVLLLGSAQLFVMGLLGEYIGRCYMEAKRRPLFIVERVVKQGQISQVQAEPTAGVDPPRGRY